MQKALLLNPIKMGWLLSGAGWAYTAGQLPSGGLLDRFGSKRVYGISIIVWSICAFSSSGLPDTLRGNGLQYHLQRAAGLRTCAIARLSRQRPYRRRMVSHRRARSWPVPSSIRRSIFPWSPSRRSLGGSRLTTDGAVASTAWHSSGGCFAFAWWSWSSRSRTTTHLAFRDRLHRARRRLGQSRLCHWSFVAIRFTWAHAQAATQPAECWWDLHRDNSALNTLTTFFLTWFPSSW